MEKMPEENLRLDLHFSALLSESLLLRVEICSGTGEKWTGTEKDVTRSVFIHCFWVEPVHPVISFHWTGKH